MQGCRIATFNFTSDGPRPRSCEGGSPFISNPCADPLPQTSHLFESVGLGGPKYRGGFAVPEPMLYKLPSAPVLSTEQEKCGALIFAVRKVGCFHRCQALVSPWLGWDSDSTSEEPLGQEQGLV